jgi:hypothetical protein
VTTCPECGGPFVRHGDDTQTCLGTLHEHGHNANATMRDYYCAAGHMTGLAVPYRCEVPGCGYIGRARLHGVTLVEEWPALAPPS